MMYKEEPKLAEVVVLAREGDTPALEDLLRKTSVTSSNPFTSLFGLLRRANVTESKDVCGRTPLMWAALRGNEDAAELLLDAGASVDTVDGKGRTALYMTCLNGTPKVARVLLNAGAKPWIKTNAGSTPLMAAAEQGYEELVDILLEIHRCAQATTDTHSHAKKSTESRTHAPNTETPRGPGQGHSSVSSGKAVTRTHSRTHAHRRTPSQPHRFLSSKEAPVLEVEECQGIDIDARDGCYGMTALSIAACHGYVVIVRKLLEAGADWSIVDVDGRSPATMARLNRRMDAYNMIQEFKRAQKFRAVRNWVTRFFPSMQKLAAHIKSTHTNDHHHDDDDDDGSEGTVNAGGGAERATATAAATAAAAGVSGDDGGVGGDGRVGHVDGSTDGGDAGGSCREGCTRDAAADKGTGPAHDTTSRNGGVDKDDCIRSRPPPHPDAHAGINSRTNHIYGRARTHIQANGTPPPHPASVSDLASKPALDHLNEHGMSYGSLIDLAFPSRPRARRIRKKLSSVGETSSLPGESGVRGNRAHADGCGE